VPYVDGNLVLFDLNDEGGQVPCAISRLALEVVSGERFYGRIELLAGFKRSRKRIEAFATRKWHARPDGVSGRLNLWADDVEDPPPDSFPAATCATGAT
jgi:hypothetical protein